MLQVDTMNETIDDEEVVRRIIHHGEKERFRELVSRYENRVYAIALRQSGNPALAEELAQEIFLKVFKNLKSFKFKSSFSTWLIRITLNHTYSYLTSKKHRNNLLTDEYKIDLHDAPHASQADSLEQRELLKAFYRCYSKLSEKFQAVITLCLFEEREYEECATLTGIPVGTVRSRLHTARKLVTECMEKESHE